jgi:pentatricopeptide repeat protein
MEAMVVTPSSSSSYRNNTNRNRNSNSSLINHPSASNPPVLQIRFPLRSPEQHVHLINDKTESSKTTGLPQNDVIKSSRRRRRKNDKKSGCSSSSTSSDVLRLMDGLGLRIPPDIYASLIRECTLAADSTRAAELHYHISRSGLRAPLSLLNRLLLMYVSCGLLDTARQLFDRMTLKKNFISWATMIVGYANDAHYDEAISLFVKMQDQFTMLEFPTWIIVCVLEACVCTRNMELGKQVHGCLHKLGVANHDLFLTSCLIEFYGKLKCREGADFVFNQLSIHNTMTWTARIISSCREEHFRDVFSYFKEMGMAGIKKSTFTFSSVLRACGRIQDDGNCGRQVHANAIKLGVDGDAFVQCGLVDMYGRSGLLRDAKLVFEMVDDKRNVACWNAMVVGYMRNGFNIEAIKFLYRMKAAGVLPPESLINDVRIACGNEL